MSERKSENEQIRKKEGKDYVIFEVVELKLFSYMLAMYKIMYKKILYK